MGGWEEGEGNKKVRNGKIHIICEEAMKLILTPRSRKTRPRHQPGDYSGRAMHRRLGVEQRPALIGSGTQGDKKEQEKEKKTRKKKAKRTSQKKPNLAPENRPESK